MKEVLIGLATDSPEVLNNSCNNKFDMKYFLGTSNIGVHLLVGNYFFRNSFLMFASVSAKFESPLKI